MKEGNNEDFLINKLPKTHTSPERLRDLKAISDTQYKNYSIFSSIDQLFECLVWLTPDLCRVFSWSHGGHGLFLSLFNSVIGFKVVSRHRRIHEPASQQKDFSYVVCIQRAVVEHQIRDTALKIQSTVPGKHQPPLFLFIYAGVHCIMPYASVSHRGPTRPFHQNLMYSFMVLTEPVVYR